MTEFTDTFYGGSHLLGSWRSPPMEDPVRWINDPMPGDVVIMALLCGCELALREGSPNIKAWECEHGNYIRCIDRFE